MLFRSILQAATTSTHDRKLFLHTLIERVLVDLNDRERLMIRIVWKDGSPEMTIEILKPRYYHLRIWELHQQQIEADEIARRLNEGGGRTQQYNPWSKVTVQNAVAILSKCPPN